MEPKLSILHIEDDPHDSELVETVLRRDGLMVALERVDTLPAFKAALARGGHGVILSDYTLPGMDALDALRLARECRPEVPFVFVSGTLGEEQAVEALKQGAADYVLKQRLGRLGPAVRRALQTAEEHARRQQAEQALHQAHAANEQVVAQLKAVFGSMTEGLVVFDAAGKFLEMNPAALAMHGLDSLQSGQHSLDELPQLFEVRDLQGKLLPLEEWPISRALRGETFSGYLVHVRRRDGGREWFGSYGGAPVRDAQGRLTLAIVTLRDVTEVRQAETALQESETRERQRAGELAAALHSREEVLAQLNALLANAPVGFAFFDREHRYVRLNEFLARQINGLPVEAHLGRPIREVLPVMAQAVDPLLDLVFSSATPLENVVVTGQTPAFPGEHRHWLTGWFPVRTPDGKIPWVGTAMMEITGQRRTQAALQRQNHRLQVLQQAAAELLVGQEPTAMLRDLHRRMAQDFGTDVFLLYVAEPDGKHLRLQACGGVSPEEEQRLEVLRFGRAVCAKPTEALEPIIATHLQRAEAPHWRFIRKLGFQAYLYYPLQVGERLLGTLAFASRRRESYDSADLEFFQAIARTMAEALERQRLEAELHRHATQLEQLVQERTARLRETTAELEQISYSIMHDMRAPLRAIQSFGSILQQDPLSHLSPEGFELLTKMRTAATRMDHLIVDVLNYSKVVRAELPLRPVDAGALVRGIVQTYPDFQPPRSEVRVAPELPRVLGNESALTQCFSNLLANAVKFAKPGQVPQIQVKAEPGEPGRVRLVVEDKGIGIPPNVQDKVFKIFHRLSHAGEGTGMGLAIVKKAAERMGGRVGLESVPGQGSRFWVELRNAE